MFKKLLIAPAMMLAMSAFAQEKNEAALVDSIEKSFKYEHGTVQLKGGVGTLTVPAGFKYLEPKQAEHVIVDLWGNPGSDNVTLGLVLPEKQGILDENGYVFNIEYDEIGYVKDDDADDINYDDLLKTMQSDVVEGNEERKKEGYPAVTLVGWASQPFYDADRKILHWAKELKFAESGQNTLNYNIRILGRKGVLVLNAISTMKDLPAVKADIPKVLNMVEFSKGNKYSDFDPKIDDVAAWTIGGLVAGKILAKVGFWAMILKFWKIIAAAVVGAFGFIRKKLFGNRGDKEPVEELKIAENNSEEHASQEEPEAASQEQNKEINI